MILFVVVALLVVVLFSIEGVCHLVFPLCILVLIIFVEKSCLIKMVSLIYLPTFYDLSFYVNYLNVLGELEAFIGSNHCDINFIVGDFNVDFDCGGLFAKLLKIL